MSDRFSTEVKQSGVISSLTSDERLVGRERYEWMGHTMHSFHANGNNFAAISSPNSPSADGLVLGVGKIEIRDVNNLDLIVTTLYGIQEFENFGHSIVTADLTIEVILTSTQIYE